MDNYRLTASAKKDLMSIARYTHREWGKKQRDKYIHELFELLSSIGEQPQLGKKRDEIRLDLLSRRHRKTHTVFYRRGEDGVAEIIRILHSRQDAHRHLLSDDEVE